MSTIRIEPTDGLRAIAFKVCTALHRASSTVVLTGGSAATVYAPDVYQSRDADFIVYLVKSASAFRETLEGLGFTEKGATYSHPNVPITLDFPDQDIRIGGDLVDRYATIEEADLVLHILTPTDCVRDRLASFFWYHDRSALAAACGVARAQTLEVNVAEISDWAIREGEPEKLQEFLHRIELQ